MAGYSDGAPGLPVWDFSQGQGNWHTYEWMVIMGSIAAFMSAWSIGANDMANAFGTSVGSRTLKLWQACLIAAVFEFTGAVVVGGAVVKTVAGSITSPAIFESEPEVFAFGMLCALLASWIWVTTATYLELAVSTTHSIIGAIMGFALVYGGPGAITWNGASDTFPYRAGFTPVVITWFTSPILTGIVAAFMFYVNRLLILRRPNSTTLALLGLPLLLVVTVFINVFFVLYLGARHQLGWTPGQAAWVAAAAASGSGMLSLPLVYWLHQRFHRQDEQRAAAYHMKRNASLDIDLAADSMDPDAEARGMGWFTRLRKQLLFSVTLNIHEEVARDPRLATMHGNMELFTPRTETVYKYLQVFSACCVSFAHGGNDVANATGPLAAIWYVYSNRAVSNTADTPRWILVLGGAGIVLGLTTYGYNIIRTLGVRFAAMTPCRGYCAELATSLTVAVASVFGLPISTTHCIVGGEVGVGMMEGVRKGANWRLLLKHTVAWVVTLFVCAGLSATIFAFGAYSPNLNNLSTVVSYQQELMGAMQLQVALLNTTNYANLQQLKLFDRTLDSLLSAVMGNATQLTRPQTGLIRPDTLQELFDYTFALLQSQTLVSVGFNVSATTKNASLLSVPVLGK